ncbi:DUF2802 domain-containing protein [Motiliproteus sediminis]|uniref:DUF2802 domain-containing protein n=1 Tax=Motiliproteus sediminis TaxID=1468178 RepID=UPI001AEFB7A6|nr:DUF2802 domain-containing protein [Motiliproteus sediminis]
MNLSAVVFPLLFALFAVISVTAMLLVWGLRRKVAEQERRHEALINVLRNEILAMNSASVGVGKRVQQVERKLNITAEKQQELENRDPGALAYNQAAKLMEMGADVDDLVSSCGIARPEAELMALLHREVRSTPSLESGR